MSATILGGKELAQKILTSLQDDVKKLDPKLVIVQVGDNVASESYIAQKMMAAEQIGMRTEHIRLDAETTAKELLTVVKKLNNDDDVTGFIIQLPLPDHLKNERATINELINPLKDVDGFVAHNIGNTFLSQKFEYLPPATPAGVISLLEEYNISIEGKNVVIVGRSNIVGKPLAMMLLNRDATVTLCHSHTKNLAELTLQADILCCAVGKPKLITAEMVKPGAIVIDIGFSREENGIVGDVMFEHVKEIASAITPVPGGIGPLTVASLLRNVVRAKKLQMKK